MTSIMIRRGLLVLATAFAFLQDAAAQQPANFGPAPGGGPPVLEIVMPPFSMGGLFARGGGVPPRIEYDPGQIGKFGGIGSPFFRFTRAHEYGHIRRNHAPQTPQQYYANELEADCFAASIYKWNSAEVKAAFQAYQVVLPDHDTPGMPGWKARGAALQRCG